MIREATLQDRPRLIEMTVRFLRESIYGELFEEASPEAIAALVAQCLKLGTIFVAEVEANNLVGMIALYLLPHPLTGALYVEELAWWVEPEHRNGMLGPKMLRRAEEWATRNGANMVKMVAPAGSTVGAFYEKAGYRPVETAFIKTI